MLPHKIVAIGSSSLAGVGDPQGGGFMGRLKKWHESNNFGNLLYNLGISGDTTTGMLKRLTSEASLRKPDLIIIASGLNDTRRIGKKDAPVTTPKDEFRNNITSLIKKGESLCDVVFVSVYPIDDTKTTPLAYWKKDYYYFMDIATEYAAIAKNVCNKENIPYFDVFNKWLETDYKKWLADDGLHANAEGHTRIYEELKNFLKDLYKDYKEST